jgi:hypothetical protein
LLFEHGRDLGVVDVAAVARLVGRIQFIQHAIRLPGQADGAYCHTLELARKRRGHIGAVLLDLQFGLDPDLFESALG